MGELEFTPEALRSWLGAAGSQATALQAQSLAVACGLWSDIALSPTDYVVPVSADAPEGLRLPRGEGGAVLVGLASTRERLLALGEPSASSVDPREVYAAQLPLALWWCASRPVPVRASGRSAGFPVVPVALAVGAVALAVAAWRTADAVEVREATRVREIAAAAQAASERHQREIRTGRQEAPGPVEQAAAGSITAAARSGWTELGESVERAGRGVGSVLLGAAALGALYVFTRKGER